MATDVSRKLFNGIAIAACALTAPWAATSVALAKPIGEADLPSGLDLFREHCAQCHGSDGRGDGPMAGALKVKPANLTTLAKRNSGQFDAPNVTDIIRYGGNISAHGTKAMPIWGLAFSREGRGGKIGEAYSRRAVIELKDYLESIQQK